MRSSTPSSAVGAGIGLLALLLQATATASESSADAANFVRFELIPDGRCQILSAGGKLRVLYNLHHSQAIEYRLIRTFAGSHPQGRVVGVAPAESAAIKLGCSEVGGRPQDWVLERAKFTD